MKPSVVAVGVPNVGVNAVPTTDFAVTSAEPLAYPVRVVVMVALDEVFAATPLTVTKPVLDIATVPPAVAVPP